MPPIPAESHSTPATPDVSASDAPPKFPSAPPSAVHGLLTQEQDPEVDVVADKRAPSGGEMPPAEHGSDDGSNTVVGSSNSGDEASVSQEYPQYNAEDGQQYQQPLFVDTNCAPHAYGTCQPPQYDAQIVPVVTNQNYSVPEHVPSQPIAIPQPVVSQMINGTVYYNPIWSSPSSQGDSMRPSQTSTPASLILDRNTFTPDHGLGSSWTSTASGRLSTVSFPPDVIEPVHDDPALWGAYDPSAYGRSKPNQKLPAVPSRFPFPPPPLLPPPSQNLHFMPTQPSFQNPQQNTVQATNSPFLPVYRLPPPNMSGQYQQTQQHASMGQNICMTPQQNIYMTPQTPLQNSYVTPPPQGSGHMNPPQSGYMIQQSIPMAPQSSHMAPQSMQMTQQSSYMATQQSAGQMIPYNSMLPAASPSTCCIPEFQNLSLNSPVPYHSMREMTVAKTPMYDPRQMNRGRRHNDIKEVWEFAFAAKFGEFPDQWRLLPMYPSVASMPCDSTYECAAKIRFICRDCGNAWTSMQGKVKFFIHIAEKAVCFVLFGQICKKCKQTNGSETIQPALWYEDEVHKVVHNLSCKVGLVCYGIQNQLIHIARRQGAPKGQHDADLCQACKQGICRRGTPNALL